MKNQLGQVNHIVHLMLENRSFDQMLGFLYGDAGNVSPAGQPFDGLTGRESNPDDQGRPVPVYRISAGDAHPSLMPGADPGEGFFNTNFQLFSTDDPVAGAVATNQGFVINFKAAIASDLAKHYQDTLPGTQPSQIMGMFAATACASRALRSANCGEVGAHGGAGRANGRLEDIEARATVCRSRQDEGQEVSHVEVDDRLRWRASWGPGEWSAPDRRQTTPASVSRNQRCAGCAVVRSCQTIPMVNPATGSGGSRTSRRSRLPRTSRSGTTATRSD